MKPENDRAMLHSGSGRTRSVRAGLADILPLVSLLCLLVPVQLPALAEGVTAEVKTLRAVPTLYIDGKPSSGLLGCTEGAVPVFERSGFRIVMIDIRFASLWTKAGVFDFAELDKNIQNQVQRYPQSYILCRLHMNPPPWWLTEHPDDVCQSDSKSKRRYASYASQAWLRDAGDVLGKLLQHIEAAPYGRRTIGCILLYGWGPEWLHPAGSAFHDYSPVAVKAFQEWLRAKYKTDAELAAAWHRPDATLGEAVVPPATLRTAGDRYEFFEPNKHGNYMADFLRCSSETVVDAIAHFSRIIKRETSRTKIVVVYYGYHFFEYGYDVNYNERGHHALDRLLACADVDGLVSPYSYRVREAGGATLAQTTVGSVRIHNKLFWLEDDTRTHITAPADSYGRARNLWESVNILRRNAAYGLSEGVPLWYLDWGNGWYADPEVASTLEAINRLADQSLGKDRRRNAEIALIVNQRSAFFLRASTALIMPLICHQREEQLPRVGAPWDEYLLQDLDRIPDYKLYIFLDALALSAAEKELIRKKVLCRGQTALWIYAPGYVAPDGLSDQAMSELTGISLASLDVGGQLRATLCDLEHPITRDCPPGLQWGTRSPVGPIITCRDPDARILAMVHAVPGVSAQGYFKTGDEFEPTLAVKKMADWTSIWCGTPDLPSALLRGIARSAGVHIYDDADDFVCANRSMVGIHARYAGKRTIRLPQVAKVTDAFSGQPVADKVTEFSVPLRQYETRMWWLTCD